MGSVVSSWEGARAWPRAWLERASTLGSGRAWTAYLVVAAALVPLLRPSGPAQIAFLDVVNVFAIGTFAVAAVASRARVALPYLGAILLVFAGSLIAVTNAESVPHSFMTLAQDVYLYAWFVVLVALLLRRRETRTVRVAWMWAANAIAIYGVGMLLLTGGSTLTGLWGARGQRAIATFVGPNTMADYLVASLFVTLSLQGEASRRVRWLSLGLQGLALVATKSNGAIGSLLVGILAWGFVRAMTRRGSFLTTSAAALVLAGGIGATVWLAGETGLTRGSLASELKASFVGRMQGSTASREQIWERLQDDYARSPLGIGPGNSKFQRVSIANRERRNSYFAKEAHSDYLGYLIERGPIAFVGLLVLFVQPMVTLWQSWRRGGDAQWRRGVGGAFLAAFVGGLVATAVHSVVMEKLHFRHYWMFLALACAFRPPPLRRRERTLRTAANREWTRGDLARRILMPHGNGNGTRPGVA